MKPIRNLPTALPRPRAQYICSNCQIHLARKSRFYSGLNVEGEKKPRNPPPPPGKGIAYLKGRRLISISGQDSTHYLQGVITKDVEVQKKSMDQSHLQTPGGGFYAAFLNAQGRLLNDVFIYRDWKRELGGNRGKGGESWLIDVDANEVEGLRRLIRKYKLRAKFDIRVLEEGEAGIFAAWGEGAGNGLGEGSGVGCIDGRAPGMGYRGVWFSDPSNSKVREGLQEVEEESYRIKRWLNGIPEGQDELVREGSLPQESNIDFMGGIDYRKGCYVGQELTIRTHHTGVVRKRILPMMVYGVEDEVPTTLSYKEDVEYGVEGIERETRIGRWEKKGRSAGKWLKGVGNVGLGLCRLGMMTGVKVEGIEGDLEGKEFMVQWGTEAEEEKMVKVKAFVPEWWMEKYEEGGGK